MFVKKNKYGWLDSSGYKTMVRLIKNDQEKKKKL